MPKRFKWREPKPAKNQPAAEAKEHETPEKTSNTQVVVGPRVQVDLVHDLRKQHKAERDEDTAQDKRQFRWTKIAAGLILAYTLLTFWQGWLTREAVNNSGKQFQIEQRPYVWHSDVRPSISILAGQRMWANIDLINYGKSPALKMRLTGKIFTGETAKDDADKWFQKFGNQSFTDPDNSEVVVPPGIPPAEPKPETPLPDIKSGQPRNEPMSFGGGGYFTIMSDTVLTQPDVDYILHTEESAIIAVRLQYYDGFGNFYWSNICMSRFVNGTVPDCMHHNEIH